MKFCQNEVTASFQHSIEGQHVRREGNLIGYAPGVFDVFHMGHLNILLRAKEQCDYLIVGVVTDERVEAVKGKTPMMPLAERRELVAALDLVDEVVVDDSVDKLEMWERLHFDVIFKGDDWRGTAKGDQLEASMAAVGAQVIYFPYTQHVSSTRLRDLINRANDGDEPVAPELGDPIKRTTTMGSRD
jgi:glycerol-3-phosphate cytidylyltransferase